MNMAASVEAVDPRKALLDELDRQATRLINSPLMERITVQNPNGGIRTELRVITVDDKAISIAVPFATAP